MINNYPSVNEDYTPAYTENIFWTKNKKIIAAVIVCLILLFILFIPKSPHSSPEAILDAWEDAINDRDSDKLYNIAADAVRGANTKSTYVEYINDMKETLGDDFKVDVEVISVEQESDDFVKINGEISFRANDQTYTEEDTFLASKVNGKWYWED